MIYKEVRIRERSTTRKSGKKVKTFEYSFEGRPEIQVKDGIPISKRKQVTKCGFKTKKEAEQAGHDHMTAYWNLEVEEELTVKQLADKYIDYCANVKKIRHTTIKSYRAAINLLCDQIGIYKIKDLKKTHAQDIAITIQKRNLCETTMSQYLNAIKQMFDYAVKFEYLHRNPFDVIDTLKSDKKGNPHQAYTPQQMQTILEAYKDDNVLYPFIMLAYHGGLREGEICGLTWNDIDFEKKTITIDKQLEVRKNHELFFVPPKYNSKGVIAVDTSLIIYLKKFKDSKERKTYSLDKNGKIIAGKDFSFVLTLKKTGNPVTTDSIYRMLQLKREVGYPSFKTHDFRHTHCTQLIANGLPAIYVQGRLRHKDPNTTMKVYAKLTEETKQKGDAKLEDLF